MSMQHFLDELDDEELRLLLTGLPDGLLERLRRKILGGGAPPCLSNISSMLSEVL